MNPTNHDDTLRTLINDSDAAELAWPESAAHAALRSHAGALDGALALARDITNPPSLRFKAYEAAHALGATIADDEAAQAAAVYVAALIGADNGHDAWGFPSSHAGGARGAGRRVVGFGRAALPALVPALANDTPLLYEGSEEPTIAEMRNYRIKDLAATWVATILGETFDVEPDDPDARDPAIATLAEHASAGG